MDLELTRHILGGAQGPWRRLVLAGGSQGPGQC